MQSQIFACEAVEQSRPPALEPLTERLCFVVDDEAGIRRIIGSAVRRSGFATRELRSVPEIVVAMAERHPELIFLDVALSASDAVDAIRELGACDYKGAVQLVSGQSQAILDRVWSTGMRHKLRMLPPMRKPFSIAEIRRRAADLAKADAKSQIVAQGTTTHLQASIQTVDLGEALANDWVTFWYQPKVDLRSRRVIGAEALARVVHPKHGVIGPLGFLHAASNADLDALTKLAVVTALNDWTDFNAARPGITIAVNATAGSLGRVPIATILRDCRPKSPAWPGLLIEVTENEVMSDIGLVQDAATQLSLYGVSLSIDDFGAGHSSFARMKSLPFAEVKLDGSFVAGCSTDAVNADLCRTIIEMAHRFGAVATAEFVANEADYQALREMGCDIGQGYLFSAPVPKTELIAIISNEPTLKSTLRSSP